MSKYSPGRSPRLSIHACTSLRCDSNCSMYALKSAISPSKSPTLSVYGRSAWLKACSKRSGAGSRDSLLGGADDDAGASYLEYPFDAPPPGAPPADTGGEPYCPPDTSVGWPCRAYMLESLACVPSRDEPGRWLSSYLSGAYLSS